MKRLMKYRFSSFYFLAGLSISLFALFDVLGIYNRYMRGLEAQKESSYTSEIELVISTSDSSVAGELEYLDTIIDGNVNIKVKDLLLKSSDSIYSWNVDVIISSRIPEHIWLTNGSRLTFPESRRERCIAAGRNRMEFAREIDNEMYLFLENQEPFLVAEEIGMTGTDYQDGYLVIRYCDLLDEWKQKLNQNGKITLRIQSDEWLSNEWVNQIVADIYKNWNGISQIGAQRLYNASEGMLRFDDNGLSIPICIYLFSGLILMQISMYWIRERRKEIVIRKAFGFNNARLASMLLGEIAGLIAVSAIIYLFLKAVYIVVIRKESMLVFEPGSLLVVFVYLAVTILICVSGPFLYMSKLSPAEILNDREG